MSQTSSFWQPSEQQYKRFVWVCMGLGAFFRLFHYFSNRSLYTDEAYLANNLLVRSFGELTQPLDTAQHAPLFFLWVQKFNLLWAGNGELALRLFPLVVGLVALLLFEKLLKVFRVGKVGSMVGFVAFAFSHPLVYYSSESKQYIVEVVCTILGLLMYFRFRNTTLRRDYILYGLGGVIILWFSYSSLFGLVSIGMVHCWQLLRHKQWVQLRIFVVIYASWGISFLLNYLLIIAPNSLQSGEIQSMWLDAFAPFPPTSVADLKWHFITLFSLFDYPLGLNWSFLPPYVPYYFTFAVFALGAMIVGARVLYNRSRAELLLLLLPVGLTYLASAFGKYPFSERLMLFAVPYFFVLMAIGAQQLYQMLVQKWPKAVWFVLLLMVMAPMISAVKDVAYEKEFGGWKRREMKAAISFLKKHKKNQETLYINHIASALPYYNQVQGLHWTYQMFTIDEVPPVNEREILKQIYLTKQQSDTFWIVVAGDSEMDKTATPLTHKQAFIYFFDTHFQKLQQFRAKGMYTAQYQFR